MTYGWAILVVAVVLALLIALGILGAPIITGPNTCVANPGFSCSNPLYTPNGISAAISQDSGHNYYGAWVFIASQNEGLSPSGLPQNFSESDTANMVPLGTLTSDQIVEFNFQNTNDITAGDIPVGNIPVGTPFIGSIWMGYCTAPGCNSPTNYAKVGAITAAQTGVSTFKGGTPSTSTTTSVSSTSTSSTTTSSTTTIYTDPTSCPACTGEVLFDTQMSPQGLSGDIITTGNVVIEGSAILLTNGHSIIAGGSFTNFGTLNTGYPGNGGCPTDCAGVGFPSSYGGSGGGGGPSCSSGSGGNGGATLNVPGGTGSCNANAGNGQTPSAPTLSVALIKSFYSGGMSNYLSGAGGGGNNGCCYSASGGSGAYGIYIQASQITAGIINAAGQNGGTSGGCAQGGGGGGGTILLAYNLSYAAGSYAYGGGSGEPTQGGCDSGLNSGGGASGQVPMSFNYGSSPPVVPT